MIGSWSILGSLCLIKYIKLFLGDFIKTHNLGPMTHVKVKVCVGPVWDESEIHVPLLCVQGLFSRLVKMSLLSSLDTCQNQMPSQKRLHFYVLMFCSNDLLPILCHPSTVWTLIAFEENLEVPETFHLCSSFCKFCGECGYVTFLQKFSTFCQCWKILIITSISSNPQIKWAIIWPY